jgi:hypothetical protein
VNMFAGDAAACSLRIWRCVVCAVHVLGTR